MTKDFWELVGAVTAAVIGVCTILGYLFWPLVVNLVFKALDTLDGERLRAVIFKRFEKEVEMRERTAQMAEETHRMVQSLGDVQREMRVEFRDHRDRLEANNAELAKMPAALNHLADAIKTTAEIQQKFSEELKATQIELAHLKPRRRGT